MEDRVSKSPKTMTKATVVESGTYLLEKGVMWKAGSNMATSRAKIPSRSESYSPRIRKKRD